MTVLNVNISVFGKTTFILSHANHINDNICFTGKKRGRADARANAWVWVRVVCVRFGAGVVVGACVCVCAAVAVSTGVSASRRGSGFWRMGGCVGVKF